MANRRMFSKEITNSSDFLMMSQSAQNLYFHFGMNADDDGFCEVFIVMRMTESKPDDLRALHERSFVYVIDSKVAIVKDWHENNQMRADRYKRSKYLDDPKIKDIYLAIMEEKIRDIEQYQKFLTTWQPTGNQLVPQVRLGKGSVGKGTHPEGGFASFWKSYPRKTAKGDAERAWKKLNPSEEMQDTIIAAVERAKQSEQWLRDGGRFIPYPATWLNGKRWEDEVSTLTSVGVDKI